jgi:hypothetical protein
LASIRAGTQLKKVSNDESARGPSPPADVGLDGMAGALARALLQRNNVIQQSGVFSLGSLLAGMLLSSLCLDSEEEEEHWAEEEEDEWGSD